MAAAKEWQVITAEEIVERVRREEVPMIREKGETLLMEVLSAAIRESYLFLTFHVPPGTAIERWEGLATIAFEVKSAGKSAAAVDIPNPTH